MLLRLLMRPVTSSMFLPMRVPGGVRRPRTRGSTGSRMNGHSLGRGGRSGPVYFRYGAFVPPSDDAPFVSTLIDPEGNEVEDPRRPTYTLLLRRCVAECFL